MDKNDFYYWLGIGIMVIGAIVIGLIFDWITSRPQTKHG